MVEKEKDSNKKSVMLLNMEIKITQEINNLYDLTYTLVDLQSILGSFYHVMLGKKLTSVALSTTRKFNKKYNDILELKDFKKGSVILTTVGTIATALIIEFLKRTIWGNGEPKIKNEYNNCIVINVDDKNAKKYLIQSDYSNINIKDTEDINKFINTFFEKVDIVQGNHEENVERFIEEMRNQGIIKKFETYNKEGIKVVAENISRLDLRA